MKEKKSKKWIWIIIIITIIIIAIFLLFKMRGIQIDTNSYGHGVYGQGGFTSFLTSLGIPRDSDITIGDEEMCLNYDCWDRADMMYDECVGGDVEFSESPIIEKISFIPSACAIYEDYFDDTSVCDEAYETMLSTECRIPCPTETYIWDGTSITNINDFYEINYPNFYESSTFKCWIFGGIWLNEQNQVGCVDFEWFDDNTCTSESISSGGNVCTTIGADFVCTENQIVCNI